MKLFHTKFHCDNINILGNINRKTLQQRHLDIRIRIGQNLQKWVRVGQTGLEHGLVQPLV